MKNKKIVRIKNKYNSDLLEKDIKKLKKEYSFLDIGIIGKSVLNKNIPYICFGKGKKEILFSAAIHSNEWITTLVLMKFIEWLSYEYKSKNKVLNLENIYENKKIYFIPMCNPDGVDLLNNNLKKEEKDNMYIISKNYPNIKFPYGWKANYNGVDLNLQFPANWEMAKKIKYSQGYTKPSPRDFVGYNPLTEPESIALYNFTKAHNFELVVAYHTQGKVIYYKYLDILPKNTLEIANKISKASGYLLEDTPYNSSFAGYKDWFIKEYNKPRLYNRSGNWGKPIKYKSI